MRPAPEVRTFIVAGTAITWLAAALTLPYVAGRHTAAVAVGVLAVPAVLSPVVIAALTTLWTRPAWGVIGWLTLEFVVITIVVAYSCLSSGWASSSNGRTATATRSRGNGEVWPSS